MSSTNKTPNLELNHWVLDDPLLMEDFNADNLLLDGAIGERPYMKIREVTTSQASTLIHFDVSNIDFSDYVFCDLAIEPSDTITTYAVGPNCAPVMGLLRELTQYHDGRVGWHLPVSSTDTPILPISTIWLPRGLLNFSLSGGWLYFQTDAAKSWNNTYRYPCSTLDTLQICGWLNCANYQSPPETIPSGTKIRLYGVKK